MEHWPFRQIMIGLIAIAMPIGFYYRTRARTDEKITHQQEGLLTFLALRFVGFGT